jgi:class 3 adenylate cyclase
MVPVTAAEFKQVTVLFADVVGSMDLAAAVDAERLREIMAVLVGRGAQVVRRYGGTVDKFTGDGLMALFGAPVALEDHAVRGCLAALAIQEEAVRLAGEVHRRDGLALQLRVGLNSGRVIAGEISSESLGYTVIGEQVGLAQRMESVAPPGGVMLSESTAHLVEHAAVVGEPQWVQIKGRSEPVCACRLLAMRPRDVLVGRTESSLVGRDRELAAVEGFLQQAIVGRGAVVRVVGAAGVGKSRLAREAAALAAGRGVEVVWAFCESHVSEIAFQVVTRLLRAAIGIQDLDGAAARVAVRNRFPDADGQDLLLLDELLGIADPDVAPPAIDPEARRRRLTALINAASVARSMPGLYVIEDVHWIDAVSESLLADLLAVLAHTPLLVLITYRPQYCGAFTRLAGGHTIALAPLGDAEAAALIAGLLGADPSVGGVAASIAERVGGNPFFAEEIVRDLAERGVLHGRRGGYVCRRRAADITVPATVQAAIEARIDRLDAAAKRTLHAASVIGSRFGADLLSAVGIDPVFDALLRAELIDQVRSVPDVEYAFRHPLIRAVAYESQLRSDRAHYHRRLAAVIQEHEPGSVEENAALIADHLESAGELPAAYGWQMRAATWASNRDLAAARVSWERARRIADTLPAGDPGQLSMRIAPRTMLCATDWSNRTLPEGRGRFADLRQLCNAAGDKVSLAIGMTGQATELIYAGRAREASRLVSEQVTLLESIGDSTLTVGLAWIALGSWFGVGEAGEVLRWSQTVIELAAGDPAKGIGFGFGSPLAVALAWRGTARWWVGRPGWHQDLHDAVAMAQGSSDPTTLPAVVAWTYGAAIPFGVLRCDGAEVRVIEETLQIAEDTSNDTALSVLKYFLGGVLLTRDDAADRHRGLELMMQARHILLRKQIGLQMIPLVEVWIAREEARRGDPDAAIPVMRNAVDEQHQAGHLPYDVWGTGLLVETLLERGAEDDLAEAREAIDRLANLPAYQGTAMETITLLRLRALLTRARGDDLAYRDYRNRYRALAAQLGYEGHLAWAEEMT